MITQDMLREYHNSLKAVRNGSADEQDKTIVNECRSFFSWLKRPSDVQIFMMRFILFWSNGIIADKLHFRSEGAIRSRISRLISLYNKGSQLPPCSIKDMLYCYRYSSRACAEGTGNFIDTLVVEKCDRFFDRIKDTDYKDVFEMRFIKGYSYRYIAFKIGYYDEGTIRRNMDRIMSDYENNKK